MSSPLSPLDWGIVAAYCVLALGLGLWFSRRASQSSVDYFLAGRSLPWWVAGISMVATTFAADTPLGVTKLVSDHGIAGNWFWWSLALAHVLGAVFFSRLWRRSGVITDASLIALRYSGPEAAVLQGIKAFVYAIVLNCITMGWVILAMAKIMRVFFDWSTVLPARLWEGLVSTWPGGLSLGPSEALSIAICAVIALAYTTLAGMWGIAATDLVQFVMAMIGSVALAWLSVKAVGGLEALEGSLDALYGADSGIRQLVPPADSQLLTPTTFIVYVGVIWWAQKYADGSGYLMQRMASTRNEEHALKGTLLFAVTHYAIRPWPWILTALAALVLFPLAENPGLDRELTYPLLMVEMLPSGLLGVAVTALLAAFMSTLDTHLNWGASYMVEDIYKRFLDPGASQRQAVAVARIASVGMVALGCVVAAAMDSVAGAWKLLVLLTAGIGSVNIARWIWWRISAWTELTALASSLGVAVVVSTVEGLSYGARVLWVVGVSTAAWLLATYLLPGTDSAVLEDFYRRIRPPGAWKPVEARIEGGLPPTVPGRTVLAAWAFGIGLVYGLVFGIGELLLGSSLLGAILIVGGVVAGVIALRLAGRTIEP